MDPGARRARQPPLVRPGGRERAALPPVLRAYYAFDNADAAPFGLSSEAAYQALRLPLVPPPLPLTRLDTGVSATALYGPRSERA